jgi:hypothetical protein
METPTGDEPDDTGATLLAAANALTEQVPAQGATACEPVQALTMEEFFRSEELDPFDIDGDFSNQVYYAEQINHTSS